VARWRQRRGVPRSSAGGRARERHGDDVCRPGRSRVERDPSPGRRYIRTRDLVLNRRVR
jgi:hypothetical protein